MKDSYYVIKERKVKTTDVKLKADAIPISNKSVILNVVCQVKDKAMPDRMFRWIEFNFELSLELTSEFNKFKFGKIETIKFQIHFPQKMSDDILPS